MSTLLLLGGGHAHAQVLLEFGRHRPAGLKHLVLATPQELTPYSGMVPGWMAGHYRWEECCIDFARLCRHAGAEMVLAEADAIEAGAEAVQVRLANGDMLAGDWLSLNIGSSLYPPGEGERVLPLRPLFQLKTGWETQMESIRARRGASTQRILMVGAGAAGVESLLAAHHAISGDGKPRELLLASHDDTLLPGLSRAATRLLEGSLTRAGVQVVSGFAATGIDGDTVHAADGRTLQADVIFWATGAHPHAWTRSCGLALDERGFVRVDPMLRSVSHPRVFASGDCAGWQPSLPKAGVYAVRMGPLLAHNLRAAIEAKPLRSYQPQRRFLMLVGTGARHAVGSWGRLGWQGSWVWRWKEGIDRAFLARYAPEKS